MAYETKIYSLIVKPVGEPLFSEMATIISVDDEAAGPFVTIRQESGNTSGERSISVEPVEWDAIKRAVQRLFDEWEIN